MYTKVSVHTIWSEITPIITIPVYVDTVGKPLNITVLQKVKQFSLSPSEQVLACCALAREKLEVGDYDAGCAALLPWWKLGGWPQQAGLSYLASAELLLVAGTLSGW